MVKANKKTKTALKTAFARRLKTPNYKPFRPTKHIKNPHAKLPNSFKLLGAALTTLKKHWRIFLGITLVYIVVSLFLVRGFSSQLDISSIKNNLKDVFGGQISGLSSSAVLFAYLVGAGSGSSSEAGGVYQIFLLLIVSLALIWALRQVLAKVKISVRDSFYKGVYPLVPFILVLLVISLQLIPLIIGSWLYATITANAIAVTLLEKVLWAVLCLLLAVLSLYMICSSLFALYIVTLPNMAPLKALRSARQLVRYRRAEILRKILFLPLILLVTAAAIFMPLVSVAAGSVEWIFFILSAFVPVIVHSYMYTLYRKLL